MATNPIVRIGVKANLNKQTAFLISQSRAEQKKSLTSFLSTNCCRRLPMGVTDCPGVQRKASCSISSISAVTVLQLTHVAQLQRKGTRRCGTSPSRVRRTTDCWISRLSRLALCTQLGSVEYLLSSALLSLPCAGAPSTGRRRHLVMTPTDREADYYSEDLLNNTQTINIICLIKS